MQGVGGVNAGGGHRMRGGGSDRGAWASLEACLAIEEEERLAVAKTGPAGGPQAEEPHDDVRKPEDIGGEGG